MAANPNSKVLWRVYNQDARNINRTIAKQERTAAAIARRQGEPSPVRQTASKTPTAKVAGKQV